MVDGKPKYVTALGETDTPAGWRANKARGGILMDVDSGEVLARGLSMPHSPRWYAGRLWVCESGSGTLGFVDLNTGKYEPVAAVPGFTRGLDFAGQSRLRRPVAGARERRLQRHPDHRAAGRRTSGPAASASWTCAGQVVALLKFETGVQEVFAVAVLPAGGSPT